MPRQKLTAKILAALKPGQIVRDETVRGLFAEAVGEKRVSFKVQVDIPTGVESDDRKLRRKTFKHTIGRYPAVSLEAARAEALRLLAEVRAGKDPRAQATAPRGAWTVQRMRDEYLADLEIRQRAERTRADVADWFTRYLADWLPLPVTHVTRAMARDRHAALTKAHGPVAANHALKTFRTAYNLARKVHDSPLPENPADAVTYAPERAAHRSIAPVDLAGWYARLGKIPNPGRRLMHEVGLFGGLRPGNLVALEREWIRLAERVVVIPAERMKARREFHLPLSGHLVALLTRALAWSREMRSESIYLWPTRSNDGSGWIATQVWRERTMPSETGHLLRHTYSNAARLAGVDDVDRELLLAHRIPGVQGTYLHTPTLFGRLLESQERISAWLLAQISTRA